MTFDPQAYQAFLAGKSPAETLERALRARYRGIIRETRERPWAAGSRDVADARMDHSASVRRSAEDARARTKATEQSGESKWS